VKQDFEAARRWFEKAAGGAAAANVPGDIALR